MTDQPKTAVPSSWLAAVIHLLNEMAGEGLGIVDCEDPANLMTEIADHLGVGDDDDPWQAAVMKLAGVTNDEQT